MSWPKRIQSRPWIYGHRGVRGSALAENTIPAFECALGQGADGIEFDVRLNQEGEVLVFHDESLERMTAGADKRLLFELPVSELTRVVLVSDGRIPTLEQVLKWAADKRLFLNIELKPDRDNAEQLATAVLGQVDALARASVLPRIVLSSFSTSVRAWIEMQNVPIPYGVLLEPEQEQLPVAPLLHNWGVHPSAESPLLRRLQPEWAFTNVWTVNNQETVQELDSFGVDGIITDRPGFVRSLFE